MGNNRLAVDIFNLIQQRCGFFAVSTATVGGVAQWHSGRTSVSSHRTFPVLHSTCSWWVTTNVGKPSAAGQPTRPTQPFILSGSINWVVSWNQMCAAVYRSCHLVKAAEVTAGLAESNGSLLPVLWRDSLHVTCRLTACTPWSAPGPMLGNEYGKTLPLPFTAATFCSIILQGRDLHVSGHCVTRVLCYFVIVDCVCR